MCVLYLAVPLTDTEPSVHMYWSDTASQTALLLPREDGSTSALLHIITDGTQNTMCMCTVIERNMEQKRHCGAFALPLLSWKANKYFMFWLRESPQLPSMQSALWPVWFYTLSTLSHKPHDFVKKLLALKRVFIFCTTFVWNISHSKKYSTRPDQKCVSFFQ